MHYISFINLNPTLVWGDRLQRFSYVCVCRLSPIVLEYGIGKESFRLAEKKESFKIEMRKVLIIERNSYKMTFGRSTPRPQAL